MLHILGFVLSWQAADYIRFQGQHAMHLLAPFPLQA